MAGFVWDEIEWLRAAVLKRARHDDGCAAVYPPWKCTCGLDELKATLQPPREEGSRDE